MINSTSSTLPFREEEPLVRNIRFNEETEVFTTSKKKDEKGGKPDLLGYVYALMPQSKVWKKYHMKKRVPFLYFYKNILDNDYVVAYCLYKAKI